MIGMTSQAVVAVARQARSALVSIRLIPGLTAADAMRARVLVAEADQLADSFRRHPKTPAAERAWLTALRALVARGSEIERKYSRR